MAAIPNITCWRPSCERLQCQAEQLMNVANRRFAGGSKQSDHSISQRPVQLSEECKSKWYRAIGSAYSARPQCQSVAVHFLFCQLLALPVCIYPTIIIILCSIYFYLLSHCCCFLTDRFPLFLPFFPFVIVPSSSQLTASHYHHHHPLALSTDGCALFRAFLAREYSEENIEFWIACEEYRKARSSKLHHKAKKIFDNFLAVRAPKEVRPSFLAFIRLAHGCNRFCGKRLGIDCSPRPPLSAFIIGLTICLQFGTLIAFPLSITALSSAHSLASVHLIMQPRSADWEKFASPWTASNESVF